MQGPPYALVGGALAATGGLLYLLFGGGTPSVPQPIGICTQLLGCLWAVVLTAGVVGTVVHQVCCTAMQLDLAAPQYCTAALADRAEASGHAPCRAGNVLGLNAGVQTSEAEAGSGVGSAQIGHYSVETHTGDKLTPQELHGDFALLYFGTTNHPDTVSELERLAEIVQQSGTQMHTAVLAQHKWGRSAAPWGG